MKSISISRTVKAGIFGVVVGDALGVPVEFTSRTELQADPVTDMREYGTHNQPKGTWSDDSSMMLATLDSIIKNGGLRYEDIMEKFRNWRLNGDFTPHGRVFDIGITCSSAISKYRPGTDPLSCGGCGERDNGNGSLMRIMPVSLYSCLDADFWHDTMLEDAVENSHNASRLTHGHPRSQIGCMIHTAICHELAYRDNITVLEAVQHAVDATLDFYAKASEIYPWFNEAFSNEIKADTYGRLRNLTSFKELPDSEIKSSGYVVHTLEAAVWCLLNSGSFADCVLKAVNLGNDTDTVGAVAGGLAGLAYGYESIPKEWIDVIVSKEWIEKRCNDFAYMIS